MFKPLNFFSEVLAQLGGFGLTLLLLVASCNMADAQQLVFPTAPRSVQTVVSVKDFGALGSGTVDDTVAIQKASDQCGTLAQGTGGSPNVNGGGTVPVGCVVYFPPPIGAFYRTTASITIRPYVTYRGAGRWTSSIRMDLGGAPTGAVFAGASTGSGWSTIEDLNLETYNGTPGATNHCYSSVRGGTNFGSKFIIQRVNMYQCFNGIDINGDTSSTSVRDVYIRNPTNHCIRQYGGSLSAVRFDTVYATNCGARGWSMEGGGSASTFHNVIGESTGTDSFYIFGFTFSSFSGIYAGDNYGATGAGYGFQLVQSSDNHIDSLFCNGGTNSQSCILLNGSFDNEFTGVRAQNIYARYVIETNNAIGTGTKLMFKPNTVRRVFITGAAQLGTLLDTLSPPNLILDGIQEIPNDPTASTVTTDAFYRREIFADHIAFRTPTTISPTNSEGYGPPDITERWSIYRDFGGTAGASAIPVYAFLGRNSPSYIGVMPAAETLGTGLITGDSSTFSASCGSWTGTANISCASVAGGVSGNAGQVQILTGGTSDSLVLTLGTLTANRLYKLSFSAHIGVAGGTKWEVRAWNNADGSRLANSEFVLTQSGFPALPTVLYFMADGATTRIRITPSSAVLNDTVLIDNFTLQDVQSATTLQVSGGRVFGNTPGGGGAFELYGAEHATKPGTVEFTGTTTRAVTMKDGIQIGTPTSGDLGAGTANVASKIALNGVQNFIAGTPTISSGFGTSPSVTGGNTAAFRVNVGTGGVATSGVIAMNATAANNWNCFVEDQTTANVNTRQTASTTTTVTFGTTVAWAASDILIAVCHAF